MMSFLSISFCWTIYQQNPESQPFKSTLTLLQNNFFVKQVDYTFQF